MTLLTGTYAMMWLYIATGFTGAWTLMLLGRAALRKLGRIESVVSSFSPKGGCEAAILKEIKAARSEILCQAYSFTAETVRQGGPDRGQKTRRSRRSHPRQKQRSRTVQRFAHLHGKRTAALDRRPPCHRAQQNHDHRQEDASYRQLQFHQPGGKRERREPARHQGKPGTRASLPSKLSGAQVHSKAAEIKAPVENKHFGGKKAAA